MSEMQDRPMGYRYGVPLRVIYKRDKGRCQLCKQPVDPDDFHLDHIVPRSLGGEDREENLRLAHPACNISRGHRVNEPIQVMLPAEHEYEYEPKSYNYNFRTKPEELEGWRSAYYKYMVQHPEPAMPFSQWLKLMIHAGIAASGVDTPSAPSPRV